MAKLEKPEQDSYTLGCNIVVTSLHWTSAPRYPSVLIVTYMNHGIAYIPSLLSFHAAPHGSFKIVHLTQGLGSCFMLVASQGGCELSAFILNIFIDMNI